MADYKPTEEQQKVLDHDPKQHARILAGPGTGKSATVVALLDTLLEANPDLRVKLLTFTRAATAELANKVSAQPAAASQRPSTIHSFSIAVLLRNPGSGDFPDPLRIADDWEGQNIVRPTLAKRIHVPQKHLNDLLREMASDWEHLEHIRNPKVDPAERARFQGGWHEHRQIYGYTLLAELPYALSQALQNHDDLKGVEYDLLIVDEYQDLNACDLKVLRLIADRGCAIIGAGDDDQSIYSFRNAAPDGIRNFQKQYLGSKDYPLTITQRCGSKIIDWASYVIEGDPDRAPRARLTPAASSPPGEAALLAFDGEAAEAKGIARLVKQLREKNGVAPKDVLILVRGDHQETFSRPIKAALDKLHIPYADAGAVERILAEPVNRRALATFHLLVNPHDSLAWATLLLLTPRVGNSFQDYIYEKAKTDGVQFGEALLKGRETGFTGAPRGSAGLAEKLIQQVSEWLDNHALPAEIPENGWGNWMLEAVGGLVVPELTQEFIDLLQAIDDVIEEAQEFSRYLGQITPLAKDIARAESQGVRIMTMTGSKGLTVRATIIAGLEDIVIPGNRDRREEQRLLFVAMTRAKEFLFGTWARRRGGPTARAGGSRKVRNPQRVRDLRVHTKFLDGGPVRSEPGSNWLTKRASSLTSLQADGVFPLA